MKKIAILTGAGISAESGIPLETLMDYGTTIKWKM